MKKEFINMIKQAQQSPLRKMTLACPYHHSIISAAAMAWNDGLAKPIFIGDKKKIQEAALEAELDLASFDLVDIKDSQEACDLAVEMTATGQADFVVKGLIDTSVLLKSYLKPEYDMRQDKQMSHVAVFNPANYDKMLFVTDASMNISPSLDQKRQIIDNAVDVARTLGVELPKVAALAAIEKVNPKMKETVEARQLQEMAEAGIIKNALVAGPLALDNAIIPRAAQLKEIDGPVAGVADIMMVPNIEIGNVLYKVFAFSFPGGHAGVIVGGKRPIVLTSRSDGARAKYNSIALAKFLMDKENISLTGNFDYSAS